MTVAEVIAALQQMPQDIELLIEGCDCVGEVGSVEYTHEQEYEYGAWREKRIQPATVCLNRVCTLRFRGVRAAHAGPVRDRK
jgi:hypothetical protein